VVVAVVEPAETPVGPVAVAVAVVSASLRARKLPLVQQSRFELVKVAFLAGLWEIKSSVRTRPQQPFRLVLLEMVREPSSET
jgi:hypothetical protein